MKSVLILVVNVEKRDPKDIAKEILELVSMIDESLLTLLNAKEKEILKRFSRI